MSEVPPQVSSIIAGRKPSDFINNGEPPLSRPLWRRRRSTR